MNGDNLARQIVFTVVQLVPPVESVDRPAKSAAPSWRGRADTAVLFFVLLSMPLDRVSGMCLIPVGCLCSAAGLLLMKAAADRPDLPPWKNPKWILGFLLLGVMATAVEIVVLGVLPLSVIAPFAGLTIVFSLLLASSSLITQPPEKLSRADGACTLLVLIGVTFVSAFGPHDTGTPTLDDLLVAYARPRFLGFVGVGGSIAATVLAPCTAAHLPVTMVPLLSAFAAASCACLSQLMLKLVATSITLIPASLPPLALALTGLILTAPLHLTLLNRTLAGAAVAIAVPCYQFLLIVCATAAGGILFDEFAAQPMSDLVAYTGGVVTATAGLVALSYNSSTGADLPLDSEEGDSDSGKAFELDDVCEHSGGSSSGDGTPDSPGLPPAFPMFTRPPSCSSGLDRRTSMSSSRLSLRRNSLINRRPSIRHSLVGVGSFGAGLGSFAALSDLQDARRGTGALPRDESPRGRGRDRAATWSEGLDEVDEAQRAMAVARSMTERTPRRGRGRAVSLSTLSEGSPGRASTSESSSMRRSSGRGSGTALAGRHEATSLDSVLGDISDDD